MPGKEIGGYQQKGPTMPKVFISTSSFVQYNASPLKLLKYAGMDVQVNPYRRILTPEECFNLYQDIDGLIMRSSPHALTSPSGFCYI